MNLSETHSFHKKEESGETLDTSTQTSAELEKGLEDTTVDSQETTSLEVAEST